MLFSDTKPTPLDFMKLIPWFVHDIYRLDLQQQQRSISAPGSDGVFFSPHLQRTNKSDEALLRFKTFRLLFKPRVGVHLQENCQALLTRISLSVFKFRFSLRNGVSKMSPSAHRSSVSSSCQKNVELLLKNTS